MLENLFTPSHLIIVLGIALFFFGGKKIAGLGQGLGEGIRGFRDGIKGTQEEQPPSDKTA